MRQAKKKKKKTLIKRYNNRPKKSPKSPASLGAWSTTEHV